MVNVKKSIGTILDKELNGFLKKITDSKKEIDNVKTIINELVELINDVNLPNINSKLSLLLSQAASQKRVISQCRSDIKRLEKIVEDLVNHSHPAPVPAPNPYPFEVNRDKNGCLEVILTKEDGDTAKLFTIVPSML